MVELYLQRTYRVLRVLRTALHSAVLVATARRQGEALCVDRVSIDVKFSAADSWPTAVASHKELPDCSVHAAVAFDFE